MIGWGRECVHGGDPATLPLAMISCERNLERLVVALQTVGRELRQARIEYESMLEAAHLAGRSPASPSSFGCLTRQERRIALLAATGKSDAQVAASAHVSVHTVKTHMKNVLRKLDLRSRWQLAQLLVDTSASDFVPTSAVFPASRDGERQRLTAG